MANLLGCADKKALPWSENEKAILLHHYESRTPVGDIIAMLPGRKRSAIMAMATRMGLSRRENPWSQAEITCLTRYYPTEGQKVLHRLPDKSDEAIRNKARELGLASPGHTVARAWDGQEWARLDQNRHLSPRELMAHFPGRSLSSIKNALIRLKKVRTPGAIPPPPVSSKPVITTWSNSEKAILTRWYTTDKSMEEILAMLPGRSRSSVFSQARKMGLSRPLRRPVRF